MSNLEWAWNDDESVTASHGHGWNGEKFPGGWRNGSELVESVLALDYFTLRLRSEHIFETNLYGRGIIKRLVTNEVHTGLSLEADPSSDVLDIPEEQLKEWSDQVEVLFAAWSSTPQVCSYEGHVEATLGEQTATARREALVGGDVLVVLRQHPKTKRPTVQLISGSRVQNPFPFDGDAIIQDGVELDSRGRHVAYHVRQEVLQGAFPGRQEVSWRTKRVKAFTRGGRRVAWLMYGIDRRSGQVRGTPLLGVVLQSLAEIDRYRDSAQRKATVTSYLAMWIEKTENKPSSLPGQGGSVRGAVQSDTDPRGNSREWNSLDHVPGMMWEELQTGEKPHVFKADGGDTLHFPDFERAVLSAVAWYCEIPPEIMLLSFNANYSASQAALNEFNMYLDVVRPRIARSFTQPVYEEWLIDTDNLGIITAPGFIQSTTDLALYETRAAWVRAEWIGSVKPTMDMLKTVRAAEIMVDRGWDTDERIARKLNGSKFSTNVRRLRDTIKVFPVREEPADAGVRRENALLVDALLEREDKSHVLDDPPITGE